jgi:hypothetical protein
MRVTARAYAEKRTATASGRHLRPPAKGIQCIELRRYNSIRKAYFKL